MPVREKLPQRVKKIRGALRAGTAATTIRVHVDRVVDIKGNTDINNKV